MNKEAKNGTAGQYALTVIARIHSDFKTKFGIPRQSGLIDALTAEGVFEPEFRNADALRGIEGFSHLCRRWAALVAHGAAAPAGRKYAHGRVCHTLAVSAQCSGTFLCAAAGRLPGTGAGVCAACGGS